MIQELGHVAIKEPGTVSKINEKKNRKDFSVLNLRGPKMETGKGFQKPLDLPY